MSKPLPSAGSEARHNSIRRGWWIESSTERIARSRSFVWSAWRPRYWGLGRVWRRYPTSCRQLRSTQLVSSRRRGSLSLWLSTCVSMARVSTCTVLLVIRHLAQESHRPRMHLFTRLRHRQTQNLSPLHFLRRPWLTVGAESSIHLWQIVWNTAASLFSTKHTPLFLRIRT